MDYGRTQYSFKTDGTEIVYIVSKGHKYGVLQGSIMGILLYIMYISDIPHISNLASFILHEDDQISS